MSHKPALAFISAVSQENPMCWMLVSSTIMTRHKNTLNNLKHYFDCHIIAFMSIVSKRSTHLANSSPIHKWPFKIEMTEPRHVCADGFRTFSFRWANTIWWISSIVSDAATSIGRADRSTLLVRVRPQWNQIHPFLFPQKIMFGEHMKSTVYIFHIVHEDVCFYCLSN